MGIFYTCVNELRKYNRHPLCRGVVPIGRTAVSKTDGWEFESLRPCHFYTLCVKSEIKNRFKQVNF